MNKKVMEIEGIKFEVVKDSTELLNTYNGFVNITDAYTRPSEIKKAIYEQWKKYFYLSDTMKVHRFGITAHNCFKFTIGAIVEIDGTMYNVCITDCHNYISRVVD